jgi:hypothetical protein
MGARAGPHRRNHAAGLVDVLDQRAVALKVDRRPHLHIIKRDAGKLVGGETPNGTGPPTTKRAIGKHKSKRGKKKRKKTCRGRGGVLVLRGGSGERADAAGGRGELVAEVAEEPREARACRHGPAVVFAPGRVVRVAHGRDAGARARVARCRKMLHRGRAVHGQASIQTKRATKAEEDKTGTN